MFMKKINVNENRGAKVFKAPTEYSGFDKYIFLAGSIEMGKAIDWQTEISNKISHLNVGILNPRRDDWDSSWEQTIENDQFRTQVQWELAGLERANIIVVVFDPKTKSPITLMELGLHAKDQNVIVVCPEGFWRKGNVDVVCQKYGITQVDTIDECVPLIESILNV
jgi:hypothetical protein